MWNRIKRVIELTSKFLFVIYLAVLLYFLFFSEEYGRNLDVEGFRYNIKLFFEIRRFITYREQLGMAAVLTNLVGNVVCFMPFGFFLPNMYAIFRRRGYLVLLLGFLTTLSVEILQMCLKVGAFDVDDIFLNSCGVILGFLLNLILRKLRRKMYAKKKI